MQYQERHTDRCRVWASRGPSPGETSPEAMPQPSMLPVGPCSDDSRLRDCQWKSGREGAPSGTGPCANLPPIHWLDASCVGASTPEILHIKGVIPLVITATGWQSRHTFLMDKYSFPRTRSKQASMVRGFRTGDMGAT